jgi:hypothetical protein
VASFEEEEMGRDLSTFIQTLVTEEIRRTVADAIDSGSTVSSVAIAEQIIRTYPNSGLTENEIEDQLMMAAAKAGVAIEIGRRSGSSIERPAKVGMSEAGGASK